uniref:Uncharacterized protein n=1 Tax=Rhizophagus irregularis (strain DAOM 181602 / DAOM 197198 / MUCL 43194) TaxID=747089 RepID=U9SHT1_RHIID
MFTDANSAFDAAIPIVFSKIYPIHYIFHIAQNLPKNLKTIVTKILDKYLIKLINNTIKTEISQCLFVTANMIEFNNKKLNCKQENSYRSLDSFIEN